MSCRKINIKHFIPAIALGCILLILFIGCGSVVDRDFTPFSIEGYHPFESVAEHGNYLVASIGRIDECKECHGSDLHGVDNGVFSANGEKDKSCYKCHTLSNHMVPFTGDDRDHTTYFRYNHWNLEDCYTCHANSEYDERPSFGGSCTDGFCHWTSELGPQACNTCHGNAYSEPSNPVNWAPPEDLSGQNTINYPGVGAHRSHVRGKTGNARQQECKACHIVPRKWNDSGHIEEDGTVKAEVVFHFPAVKGGFQPVYNYDTNTCSATYCHGGRGANWTTEGGWSECTSCHGIPPEGLHPQFPTLNQCYECHGDVIDPQGRIINPQLHVNGGIN